MASRVFAADYASNHNGACSMLGGNFRDPEHRNYVLGDKAALPRVPELATILQQSNQRLPPSPSRDLNVERLLQPGSVAIVTGQQVGLFGGPSFTLYKALSAVATARTLEGQSGIPCVPVFWVQNQDHDLAEVNTVTVPDSHSQRTMLKVEESDESTNRVSLAHLSLNDSVAFVLDTLDELLGRFAHGPELLAILSNHYKPGSTYSVAFTNTLAELTSDYGLVFVDPSIPEIVPAIQPIYQRAFDSYSEIAQTLTERGRLLASKGYNVQVHVRSNSPLFFVHPDGAKTPRFRVEIDGASCQLVGSDKALSVDDLECIVSEQAEKLSPSALLRPLLQDYLLPTAAYVAGDAEINYFAQIAPLYKLMQLEVPLLVPRASITFVESKHRHWLNELNLTVPQLKLTEGALISEVLKAKESLPGANPEELRRLVDGELKEMLKHLENSFIQVDRTLIGALDNSRKKISYQIDSLLTKYEKALAQSDKTVKQRIEKLQNAYFPDGIAQERVISAVYFLARFGPDFTEMVLNSIEPLENPNTEIDVS